MFGSHTGVNRFSRHRRVVEPRHQPNGSVKTLRDRKMSHREFQKECDVCHLLMLQIMI